MNADRKPDNAMLVLPGRSGFGEELAYKYAGSELGNTLFIGITPKKFEWYPMPNGAEDQNAAIEGVWPAFETITRTIDRITHRYGIPRERIGVTGFSAGGVMSIQTVALSDTPLAAGICHCGAILDVDALPEAKHETPLLIFHNKDDYCFDWDERYVPMKKALKERGYKCFFVERERGGHHVHWADVIVAGHWLSRVFDYPKEWKHSRSEYIDPVIKKWKPKKALNITSCVG